jgi:hypothetical protein
MGLPSLDVVLSLTAGGIDLLVKILATVESYARQLVMV